MTNPPGVESPHMIIQSGGSSQASVWVRSVMIQNENTTFQNSVDATNCIAYMNMINETLKIDCNTTTTGADLLVSDDLQIVGDVWIKDTSGEWHFMTRELSNLDSLKQGTTQGSIMFNHNDTAFSVYNSMENLFVVNIQGVNYDVNNNATVALNSGTNTTPIRNYLSFQKSGSDAVLTNDASYPSTTAHSDTALIIKGASGNVYLHVEYATLTKNFIYELYDRAANNFEQYISGFAATANSSSIGFTAGEYWTVLSEFDSDNALDMLADRFYIVHNNGSFEQCADLSCLDEYNDGTAIDINAEFNVVWAIVPDSDNTSRLIAIPQTAPGTTYTTVAAAEQDSYNTITYSFDDTEINKYKLVLARTIVDASADDFSAFSNGAYYQTLIGIPSAGASAGGTNDHSLLNNLDYASAGHTGFASDARVDGVVSGFANLSQDETITGNYKFISSANVTFSTQTVFEQNAYFQGVVYLVNTTSSKANTSFCVTGLSGTCEITLNVSGTTGTVYADVFNEDGTALSSKYGAIAVSNALVNNNITMYASNASQAVELAALRASNLTKAFPGTATCAAGTVAQNVTTTTTGTTSQCIAVIASVPYQSSAAGWSNTSTTSTTTNGDAYIGGNIYLDANGGNTTAPKVLQFNNYSSGEAIAFVFDSANGLYNSYAGVTQIYGYHSIVLRGDTSVIGYPATVRTDSDASVVSLGSQATSIVHKIIGAAGQTGDYLKLVDSAGANVFNIQANGSINVTGDINMPSGKCILFASGGSICE
jgi:hypothetical protein